MRRGCALHARRGGGGGRGKRCVHHRCGCRGTEPARARSALYQTRQVEVVGLHRHRLKGCGRRGGRRNGCSDLCLAALPPANSSSGLLIIVGLLCGRSRRGILLMTLSSPSSGMSMRRPAYGPAHCGAAHGALRRIGLLPHRLMGHALVRAHGLDHGGRRHAERHHQKRANSTTSGPIASTFSQQHTQHVRKGCRLPRPPDSSALRSATVASKSTPVPPNPPPPPPTPPTTHPH